MKISVLNLAPLRQNDSAKDAIDAMVRLAKYAESIGIQRYWIAEHHNMKNLASSATSLLIQHVLSQTTKLHVGSGGVMLPNHAPYVVAEQYGTLATIYPNRVELGIGRAPGTDMQTARALRRTTGANANFKAELDELRSYFDGTNEINAYPAKGIDVPFYILGSSTDSAYLAAELGLAYAFASHFAPRLLEMAVAIYRQNFKPSKYLKKPYVIVGANVVVADTNEEAVSLATTQTQFFLNVVTNTQQNLQPPLKDNNEVFDTYLYKATKAPHFGPVNFADTALMDQEKMAVMSMMACSFIGSKQDVQEQLQEFRTKIEFNELMVQSFIYDEQKQLKSYKYIKQIADEMK